MGVLLNDLDVRRAAYNRLLTHACRCPHTLVIDELGLDHGACRVDIAVINGHLRGIEIKAEADTLARLPRQVAAYGAAMDKASLIVAEKHYDAARTQLPDWWGVILAQRTAGGSVAFRRLRPERSNRDTQPLVVARLLWRPEVAGLLRGLGEPERALRGPREELYERLIASVSRATLGAMVRKTLKARASWRGHARPA
ncbi:hypothetical protein ASG67_12325 [Sphingomonas sp. Leaf339]|uniref:sce7726 family protein n=1 Tax=Sphingomonas sp. Leaf339 TaxID=1736343 RepID=UPI0006F73982|nr:sce7726 family protein [Sphingomonas sp. Leaf339]KQU48123.1 hypothetical protein ASG67_12325 [Sphingomonas sp. Leaf339]